MKELEQSKKKNTYGTEKNYHYVNTSKLINILV